MSEYYTLDKNYVPVYHYILEKDGEELEFSNYGSMIEEVRGWDEFEDKLYEFEKDLESSFPVDSEDEREMWVYDVVEEVLEEIGWQVHKVLR